MAILAVLAIIVIIIIRILNAPQIDIFSEPAREKEIMGSAQEMNPSDNILTKLSAAGSLHDIMSSILSTPVPKTIVRKTDIPGTAKYQGLKFLRRALHVGQLKLFLSEVQFLTECAPTEELKAGVQVYVIYAGSGPGHTRQSLADMFPRFKFILIDPQEHNIMGAPPESRLYFRLPRQTNFPHEVVHMASQNGIIKRPKGQGLAPDEILGCDRFAAMITNNPSYTFYIIEDLFTNEIAQEFRSLCASGHIVLFISDIRTNIMISGGKADERPVDIYDDIATITGSGSGTPNAPAARESSSSGPDRPFDYVSSSQEDKEDSPHDIDIIVNNAWQHTWVHILQPSACMLKFRTPFMNPDDKRLIQQYSTRPMYRDTLIDYAKRFKTDLIAEYMKGRYLFMANDHINLQAFPGSSSTETRLIAFPEHYDKFVEYKTTEHEDKLFYYNLIRECYFTDRHQSQFGNVPGFDGCLDCDLAYEILDQYAKKFKSSRSPIALLRDALWTMHRPIKSQYHGNLLAPIQSVNQLQQLIISRTTYTLATEAMRKSRSGDPRKPRRAYPPQRFHKK